MLLPFSAAVKVKIGTNGEIDREGPCACADDLDEEEGTAGGLLH